MGANPYSVKFAADALRQYAEAMRRHGDIIPRLNTTADHLLFAADRLEFGSRTEAAYQSSIAEFERENADQVARVSRVGASWWRSLLIRVTAYRYSLVELAGVVIFGQLLPNNWGAAFAALLLAFLAHVVIRAIVKPGKAVAL